MQPSPGLRIMRERSGRVKASLAALAADAALTRPARSRPVGNYRSDAEYLRYGFVVSAA